jgi:hypothetical protein
LKAKLESSSIIFVFHALNFRRFQHGFHRVNLHRPTMPTAPKRWRMELIHHLRLSASTASFTVL